MARIEQTADGRYFIRTSAGAVARNTSCEPWYSPDMARANAALAYLAMDWPARKSAPHWLKSMFGMEG